MSHNQNFGKWGEKEAVSFLIRKGLSIVEQNWRSGHGEIDIIARDDKGYIFVEVKTRGGDGYGFPEQAITKEKRNHLIQSVLNYIDNKQITDAWRIDVVSIRKLPQQHLDIEWFQNAINEE